MVCRLVTSVQIDLDLQIRERAKQKSCLKIYHIIKHQSELTLNLKMSIIHNMNLTFDVDNKNAFVLTQLIKWSPKMIPYGLSHANMNIRITSLLLFMK